jgi:nucleoside phosphorylase
LLWGLPIISGKAMDNNEVLLLAALELERDAVLEHVNDAKPGDVAGFPGYSGTIGRTRVTVLCLNRKGNVNAAARVPMVLERLRPSAVLLVGIAGGTKRPSREVLSAANHFFGDVLVAEQIVDYESGKQTSDGIQRRPRAYQCSDRLLAQSRDVNLSDWAMAVKCIRPDGTTGRVVPRVHYGTFASGEKVVADEGFIKPLEEVWTELVAVEMEGLGVAVACHQHHPLIDFLLIKAICDWADPEKRDEWQQYAAAASAAFAAAIVRKLTPSQPSPDSARDKATFDPTVKLRFIQRIGPSWKDLADAVGIASYERNRFSHGDEPRAIWEWLEDRGRLGDLRSALLQIGRSDVFEAPPVNPP